MAKFTFYLFLANLVFAFAQVNYNAGDHSRSETIGPNGEVTGEYSYTGSDGKLITTRYTTGKDGFQVVGDHIPQALQPNKQPNQQQSNQFSQDQQYQNQPQNYFQQQNQQPYFSQPHSQPQQQQYFPQQQQQPQPQQQYFQQQQQPNNQQNYQSVPIPQLPNFPTQQNSPSNFFQQAQPQPQPQNFFNPQPNPNSINNRPTKVNVQQNPGQGFSYNIEN